MPFISIVVFRLKPLALVRDKDVVFPGDNDRIMRPLWLRIVESSKSLLAVGRYAEHSPVTRKEHTRYN